MKVVIHFDGKTIRGNENQVFAVARRLHSGGHDVIACCRANTSVEAALRKEGIRTSSILPKGDIAPLATLRFALWLRREQPDCILLTSWKKVLVAGWAARFAGIRRVVLRVGGVHERRRAIDIWKYRYALTNYFDVVIVNSSTVKSHLVDTIPSLPVDKLRQISNGIDRISVTPCLLLNELGIPREHVLVFASGGLEHRKGFDLLISAVATLEPEIHLVIAGDGPLRDQLTALATSMGIGRRFHLLGHRSDVTAILGDADMFVVSSRNEGMAVAMLEAMAVRRPVISADIGGVTEALAPTSERSAGGWIVAREDVAGLSRTLAEVIHLMKHDRAAVDARVDEAAWRIHNWFSLDRMTEEYERVLVNDPAYQIASANVDVSAKANVLR